MQQRDLMKIQQLPSLKPSFYRALQMKKEMSFLLMDFQHPMVFFKLPTV